MSEVIVQTQTTEIVSGAKEALELNQNTVAKAKGIGVQLIGEINLTSIQNTPNVKQLDEQCKSYLKKVTLSIAAMNERRKPITQAFDTFKKAFTTLENELKNSEEINKIKEFRNKFAQLLAAEEEKREAEVRRNAAINQEKIDIRASIKKAYTDDLLNTLDIVFTEIEDIFNDITLVNAYKQKEALNSFSQVYKPCDPQCQFQYITQVEFNEIKDVVSPTSIDVNTEEFSKAVREKKQYYLDRVESKIAELVKISNADKDEKERLEKEVAARVKKEAEDKKTEILAYKAKQETAIEAEKTEATIGNLFEQNYTPPLENVKKVLEIEILNNAAYGQIFMFWYEKVGKDMPQDKLEKVTVARMKKLCEDIANKDGEIIESSLLKYNEVVTAK